MSEYKSISVPRALSLSERISWVSKEISGWLESLEEPFDIDMDVMRLTKFERNGKYVYHYIIDRAVR
jgi:hypothetical protein